MNRYDAERRQRLIDSAFEPLYVFSTTGMGSLFGYNEKFSPGNTNLKHGGRIPDNENWIVEAVEVQSLSPPDASFVTFPELLRTTLKIYCYMTPVISIPVASAFNKRLALPRAIVMRCGESMRGELEAKSDALLPTLRVFLVGGIAWVEG